MMVSPEIFSLTQLLYFFIFQCELLMYCRQKTDYDDDCLPKFDGIPEAAGCRVYGDCDTFIRKILKNVIGDERLKSWEGDRPQRIVSYEKNRCQKHSV